MKKIKVISIAAIAALMTLGACGGKGGNSSSITGSSDVSSFIPDDSKESTSREDGSSLNNSSSVSNPNSSSNNSSSSSYEIDEDEEYSISVTQTTGVTASLSKTKAKKGDVITLTLKVENGYKVKEVKATNTPLTKVSDTKYQFVMPDRSVRISIFVDVEGDVCITGEIAAQFVKDATKNLYVAKDVKVESTKAKVGFDVVVKDAQGNPTKLRTIDFDESRSFADVESTYQSNYALQIASGSTYDFYYEPDSEFPLYIVRTRVDKIPTTANEVYALFYGRMRSSPACHPTGLVGIDYTYESSELTYDYNYKIYQNNIGYGKVVDKTDVNNIQNYHVYKEANLDTGVYKVVNTWTKAKGNNENADYIWNLDPNRNGETTYYQPYAAELDITDVDTDNARYEISKRDAVRNVNASAHYGAELEYEFYDTYRSVYDGNVIINAPKNYNLDLKSTKNEDGTFKVTINSWTEYDYEATANTADVTAHEGNVYKNELVFLANGALKTLDCTKTHYEKKVWDFVNHKPNGAGEVTHFTCNNTFGNAYAGKPDFDLTPYFVSKINAVSWYNTLTGKGPSTTESHVNYNEVLETIPMYNNNKKASNCSIFSYEPSTALDGWQYQIASVEDATKIAKNAQRKWQCIGVGTTNVTVAKSLANVKSSSFTTKVNIYAAGTVHGFFINCTIPGYDSYQCNNSTVLEAYAGKQTTYYVDTSVNTGAPCEYTLYFRTKNMFGDYEYKTTNDYIKVVQTGTCLILDCNTEAANALKDVYSVTVKVMSDYYLTNWGPSSWEIRVHPKDPNAKQVIGSSWIFDSYVDNKTHEKLNDYTLVNFSSTRVDADNGIYLGTLTDYQYDGEILRYTNVFTFHYQIAASGMIRAQLKGAKIESPDFAGEEYYYFGIEFGGFQDGLLLVALWYDNVQEYADIIGTIGFDGDEQVYVESYYGFRENNAK